jgi:adenylate cyclase
VLYPTLTLGVVYVTDILYMIVREQSDKKFVKELFGRYVSPQISKEIVNLASGGELNLGGQEIEATVLFADIRNFTTLSERKTPQKVVEMLNACLPIVIESIVQNGGLVNKFAGDNLMGVWNAPQPCQNHALLAIRAAWDAQRKMSTEETKNSKISGVQFGIGINTGIVLAGNVGSTGRVEYTVIGDAVNLASRICGGAPGGEIVIGPETYRQVKDLIEVEALEPQMFKGKTQPVPVFRVTGMK